MNLPFFSALISPASRSSLRWNEIVELNCSVPVTWQHTSPTVAPCTRRTSPDSPTATGRPREQKELKDSGSRGVAEGLEHGDDHYISKNIDVLLSYEPAPTLGTASTQIPPTLRALHHAQAVADDQQAGAHIRKHGHP